MTKIMNKEVTICETCDSFFEYVPQRKYCDDCRKKRIRSNARSRYWDDPARRHLHTRKYYKKNREMIRAKRRKSYKKNREMNREQSRKYYQKNRETLLTKKRKYRAMRKKRNVK